MNVSYEPFVLRSNTLADVHNARAGAGINEV
jgi:hypothetical protein